LRLTHDNWEKKITWMRERIHEKRGAVDLTDAEQKTIVDYLAKNFSDTTPKIDPNGRLSRTALQGAAAKYIAVDFAVPNSDSALHDGERVVVGLDLARSVFQVRGVEAVPAWRAYAHGGEEVKALAARLPP
jgi:hypothetical protein